MIFSAKSVSRAVLSSCVPVTVAGVTEPFSVKNPLKSRVAIVAGAAVPSTNVPETVAAENGPEDCDPRCPTSTGWPCCAPAVTIKASFVLTR